MRFGGVWGSGAILFALEVTVVFARHLDVANNDITTTMGLEQLQHLQVGHVPCVQSDLGALPISLLVVASVSIGASA